MRNAAMVVREIASTEGPRKQLTCTSEEAGWYNVRVEAATPDASGPNSFRLERGSEKVDTRFAQR